MANSNSVTLIASGIGVVSNIAQGKADFAQQLFDGAQQFGYLSRPGRHAGGDDVAPFIGAEIKAFDVPSKVNRSHLRTASLSAQLALCAVDEAWQEAKLDGVAKDRIGLVVGGSNVQQRELVLTQQKYLGRSQFIRPAYGLSFMDSDIGGLCSEVFGITGMAYTIGGASASGQVAVIEACEAVKSGRVDVCIAVGAMMDLSYWELQGFRALGAMGSNTFGSRPELACRPYSLSRDGFIFGENCAAIVIERVGARKDEGLDPYAEVAGWAMKMDANRNPDPSVEGEVSVIAGALGMANWQPSDIDYVNPHGTGSPLGDETELEALRLSGLSHAYINTTKSIVGHGLTAAGAVETVATLLQLKAQKLHPSRNVDDPMIKGPQLVTQTQNADIKKAIKMSMGFGGMNTAVCWQSI